ncbi:MAG TPA: TMEM175 family protein [Ktedonobacterales bacterium]|nr:TMEM175 family protein [Ktedonobacterales bacterium]
MINEDESRGEAKETGRLEAFSDGIFAVAITLLVLEIKIPPPETSGLGLWVLAQWPSFLAYFISFMTILIMWINHHSIFRLVHRTNHTFMVLNGVLLLLITFVNYPTAVLAEHLQAPAHSDQSFVGAFYSATFVVISLAFQALWRYATYNRRLLGKKADPALVATIHKQYRFGPLFYIVAFALAFVNVWASVAVNGGLAVYFAFTGQMTRASSNKQKQVPHEQTPEDNQPSAKSSG